jgi:hypothetical protein
MTQILTSASWGGACQVSDRLVTVDGSAFDPAANKSIVIGAKDGIAALSYTGLAFLGGVPTDQWLAELLLKAGVETGNDAKDGNSAGEVCTECCVPC